VRELLDGQSDPDAVRLADDEPASDRFVGADSAADIRGGNASHYRGPGIF